MIPSVVVFGYRIPTIVVLVFVALVIGLALAVSFWLTIGWSTYRSVQQTRRERVRDDLQTALLDRLFEPDVDWEPWVTGLSQLEREVVESLLDEYLRELDGSDLTALRELGRELGIVERSRRQLQASGEHTRLTALTWLTLLSAPEALKQTEFEPQTPRERAAVARLRHETDDLHSPSEGVSILLDDATTQFGVFGQDTLYRIANEDPAALFALSAERSQQWSKPLLVQVLVVCQHVGSTVTTEDLSWITAMLEHEDEGIRAAAARALAGVGWRTDVRDDLFVDRLLADPSPRVRTAVYEMLAGWSDSRALDLLAGALATEPHDRARLAGITAFVERGEELPGPAPKPLAVAHDWASEHAAYDRQARRPQRVSQ